LQYFRRKDQVDRLPLIELGAHRNCWSRFELVKLVPLDPNLCVMSALGRFFLLVVALASDALNMNPLCSA